MGWHDVSGWKVAKQRVVGNYENGEPFDIEIDPAKFHDILVELFTKYLGREVKDAQIIFK